jgi:hypothetical protein
MQSETGLTPDDVQALLGDGLSVALDSSVDLGGLFTGAVDPSSLPVGVRIVGDPDEILPVIDKAVVAAGAEGQLAIETRDGVVAIGLDRDYVRSLSEDGALADEDTFDQALPDFDESNGFFVDFDAGDWLTGLFENDPGAAEVRENVAPLNSLGISSTTAKDGELHALVRLTTD